MGKESNLTFLSELIAKSAEPKHITTFFKAVTDPTLVVKPDSLLHILCLDKSILSETANLSLDTLEDHEKYQDSYEDWLDFKWKLMAFISLQDIFDSPIYEADSILNMFHIWYFYFESKYLLNEAIICGLNGLYSASNSLLRPFLEFNILQNYYYLSIKNTENYKILKRYFETHSHPSWGTILKKALPDEPFTKPIKFRLRMHLKALSENFSHPYHPDISPRQHVSVLHTPSLEGIFFWENIRFILEATLWMYYVNFPMLFHPKNIVRKFGFNGPVGLFVDELNAHIIKKTLEDEDYNLFFDYSSSQETVVALTEWYESLDALTDEQILSTWNIDQDGEIKDIIEGHGKQMAKLRGIKELMAMHQPLSSSKEEPDFNYREFFSYSLWERLSKKKLN